MSKRGFACVIVVLCVMVGISLSTGQPPADKPVDIEAVLRKVQAELTAMRQDIGVLKKELLAEMQKQKPLSSAKHPASASVAAASKAILGRWDARWGQDYLFKADGSYVEYRDNKKGSYKVVRDLIHPGRILLVFDFDPKNVKKLPRDLQVVGRTHWGSHGDPPRSIPRRVLLVHSQARRDGEEMANLEQKPNSSLPLSVLQRVPTGA